MRRFEYDEAYEDEDVYDDDEPGYHPVDDDDEPDLDLNAPGLDIAGALTGRPTGISATRIASPSWRAPTTSRRARTWRSGPTLRV